MFLIYLAIVCLFAFEKLLFKVFYVLRYCFHFQPTDLLIKCCSFASGSSSEPISLCEKELLAFAGKKFCLFRVPCKITNNCFETTRETFELVLCQVSRSKILFLSSKVHSFLIPGEILWSKTNYSMLRVNLTHFSDAHESTAKQRTNINF